MTEKQYRVSTFEEKFKRFKNKRIVLYGIAANSRAIIERFGDSYNILGLMTKDWFGAYRYGKRLLSPNEVIELQTDIIIIAAQIPSAEAVYGRLLEFCMNNHILLYDMYGNNAIELHRELTKQKIAYFDKHMDECRRCIDRYDVISFDMMDTFVMRKVLSVHEIFDLVNEDIPDEIVVQDYKLLRCKAEEKSKCCGMADVYDNFRELSGLAQTEVDAIMQLEVQKERENAFVRAQMIELCQYAKEQGKKVVFVSDWLLPEAEQKKMLAEAGIVDYDGFFSEEVEKEKKTDGLYRCILRKFRGQKLLHIGDDEIKDWIAPRMYGFVTYVVLSPFETLQASEHFFTRKQIDYSSNRWILGEFIAEVFEDPFVLHRAKGIVSLTEEQKREIAEIHLVDEDVHIEYKPVLFKSSKKGDSIEEYEKLKFPVVEEPLVSIVIPVYNQFDYTYLCLKSILRHSGDIKYEVIIADDFSTDYVKNLEQVADGITVIHNKENLRFLLNCNHAAEQARGKYILFLNNDTQVQPGWLRSLVELIENDATIGMVGSKLVYPDGYLQEAGGILWNDASAWNFGRRQDPDKADFNYVKDVDYISGASIMIRTELWKEIGGFDERFVPAYCEDSDLAFEVRKHGKRVVYQPLSVVVHFEGVSNGTDTGSGLKAYQVVNNKKFYEKWKDVLEKEHFSNGSNVLLARDRSRDKKHILVVDHYVPNFDKDAGGRCTYMYLKMFLKMGMQVTFIGDNFAKPEPYTSILSQMGIEVLYGNFYYLHWQEWLKGNLKYFDYIYLQRPHISIKYIDLVKEYGRGKIFYFAHDLHHVRMYRDYLITGKEEALKESEDWKKIEMELFEKADVGHVVGSYEQEIMQKAFPEKPIRNIPLYIYDDVSERIEKDFSKRTDILFVGGFKHEPNIDAVLWFGKEIFPRILKKYPDMVWHIVGNGAPEEVRALENEHTILEGFVTDEQLGELYRKCRLVVVPLRYGAGVKGKIVEAAYYQIPVVTTAIGGEGLDASVGSFVMEDDTQKMAELVETLYTDYAELKRMSDAGETMIQRYFTSEAAEQVLLSDMDI